MKKLLGLLVLMLFVSGIAGAFTETLPPASAVGNVPVSNGYDWGVSTTGQPIGLLSKTSTQLITLTPNAAGTVIFCSNCVSTPVCVSSGTGQGAWVAVSVSTASTTGFGTCK